MLPSPCARVKARPCVERSSGPRPPQTGGEGRIEEKVMRAPPFRCEEGGRRPEADEMGDSFEAQDKWRVASDEWRWSENAQDARRRTAESGRYIGPTEARNRATPRRLEDRGAGRGWLWPGRRRSAPGRRRGSSGPGRWSRRGRRRLSWKDKDDLCPSAKDDLCPHPGWTAFWPWSASLRGKTAFVAA